MQARVKTEEYLKAAVSFRRGWQTGLSNEMPSAFRSTRSGSTVTRDRCSRIRTRL